MTNFESSVKVIPYSQERVYTKLSDFNNLQALQGKLPEDKVKDLSFDADTVSFNAAPVGQLTLKIVERNSYTSLKFETTHSPLPFTLWIQIEAVSEEECKLKIVAGIELNPFMKAMVQKPLQEGLEKMADTLSMIQY